MTAKSNAREGDGVADHVARLVTLGDSLPKSTQWDEYRVALTAAIAAMQAQQGAEPVATYCGIAIIADHTLNPGELSIISGGKRVVFQFPPATGAPR